MRPLRPKLLRSYASKMYKQELTMDTSGCLEGVLNTLTAHTGSFINLVQPYPATGR